MGKPPFTLLLTCAGRKVSLVNQFRRAFDELDLDGQIIGVDSSTHSAVLSVCDKSYIIPRCDHPAYVPTLLDKALFACDELCGFITACALVRPNRLEELEPKSVRKKMKQASFAAAVHREDITEGAANLGVDLDEHIAFCIAALREIAADLGLMPVASQ